MQRQCSSPQQAAAVETTPAGLGRGSRRKAQDRSNKESGWLDTSACGLEAAGDGLEFSAAFVKQQAQLLQLCSVGKRDAEVATLSGWRFGEAKKRAKTR